MRTWKLIGISFAISLVLVLAVIFVATDVFAFSNSVGAVTVIIPENASRSDVADALHETNLVRFPFIFSLYAHFRGFGEEYFFRGAVMLEYRFAGVFGSAFFSALLFAAVHLSLSLFVLYFVCGLMLSFTVFLTGDVKMAVVSHILYNLYALFAERDVYLLAYDEESRVLFLAMAGVCVLLALWGLLKVSETLLRERTEDEPPIRVPKGKGFFVFYDIVSTPSLWLVAIVFLLFTLLRHFL